MIALQRALVINLFFVQYRGVKVEMKRILFSPIFNYPSLYFTGDNVAHYLPGKYLWHVCNVKKSGFQEPIYKTKIEEEVSLSFVFLKEQPQHFYFKKPKWIDEFLIAKDKEEINHIARKFDFFVNLYRYRGAQPPETNCGYTSDLNELNLHLPAIHYKSVFEENVYINDLSLSDKHENFLTKVVAEIAPNQEPIIALHNRGLDPWSRHQPLAIVKYEKILNELLSRFPSHILVLVGESWKDYRHPRVKKLSSFISMDQCHKILGERNACLQYILSAFFCRNAEMCFVGISGFSLFIESIRPLHLTPPIPVFWDPASFEGQCTSVKLMQKTQGWYCSEYEEYKMKNPHDTPYQFGIHHFLYYSRDEAVLKQYCFDNPNTPSKIIGLVKRLRETRNLCWPPNKKGTPLKFWIRTYYFFYHLSFYTLRLPYRLAKKYLRSPYRLAKKCFIPK